MVGYSGSDVTDLILDYTVPTCPDPEDPPECPEIPELVTGTGVEGQLALLNYWMEIQTMYPNYYKLFWDDYTTPMLSDVILPAGLRAYNES
ncbi:MAG: hypothetical protein LBO09_06565 [Candidatus Peribacteria bacterium]|jgi:hypothetical protein|nr:hypothetical protein [Candidatus Peribacteria bacterium]